MCSRIPPGGKGHGYFCRNASYGREGLPSTKSLVDATVCKEVRPLKERVPESEHDQSTLDTRMNMS